MLSLSALSLVLGFVWPSVFAFLGGLWNNSLGRIFLTLLLILILAASLYMIITFFLLRSAIRKRPADDAAVIVLGCQVIGSEPTASLVARLETALAYLNEHPSSLCILSGGKGTGEDISEAECMRRRMTSKGFPEDRLIIEDRSISTYENLKFSKELLPPSVTHIAIVSNDFHGYRALTMAKSLGLDAGFVPAPTKWWLLPTFFVREQFALVHHFLFTR